MNWDKLPEPNYWLTIPPGYTQKAGGGGGILKPKITSKSFDRNKFEEPSNGAKIQMIRGQGPPQMVVLSGKQKQNVNLGLNRPDFFFPDLNVLVWKKEKPQLIKYEWEAAQTFYNGKMAVIELANAFKPKDNVLELDMTPMTKGDTDQVLFPYSSVEAQYMLYDQQDVEMTVAEHIARVYEDAWVNMTLDLNGANEIGVETWWKRFSTKSDETQAALEMIRYMCQDKNDYSGDLAKLSNYYPEVPEYWALMCDMERGYPDVWIAFSVTYDEKHKRSHMLLHGWVRSLVGKLGRDARKLPNTPVGEKALSFLVNMAHALHPEWPPISSIFCEVLTDTFTVATRAGLEVFSTPKNIAREVAKGEPHEIIITNEFRSKWKTFPSAIMQCHVY